MYFRKISTPKNIAKFRYFTQTTDHIVTLKYISERAIASYFFIARLKTFKTEKEKGKLTI